jgi:hypothetical protein
MSFDDRLVFNAVLIPTVSGFGIVSNVVILYTLIIYTRGSTPSVRQVPYFDAMERQHTLKNVNNCLNTNIYSD